MKPKLKRLEKIVDHLRNGKLIHEEFDFSRINSLRDALEEYKNGCGTLGCAMGEFPAIFPKNYIFKKCDVVRVDKNNKKVKHAQEDSKWLGLTKKEHLALFYPFEQDGVNYMHLPLLDRYATKEQVADNIEKFINYHKNLKDANI